MLIVSVAVLSLPVVNDLFVLGVPLQCKTQPSTEVYLRESQYLTGLCKAEVVLQCVLTGVF